MRTEVRRGRKFIEYIDDSLPAGTFVQEISGADVSYRDDDGKWKPISTKFSAKSGDFAFTADRLNHKIEVGNGGERRWYPRREITDEYLTLGKPEYYNPKNDKWQPLNITGSSVNGDDGDTVELDTNQDLTVFMHSRWNGLKVDYVLGSDKAPTRFRFSVGIIGLEYKDDKLYGKDGELVGILTPTIARDANDKELSAFGTYDGEYLEFGVEAAGDAAYPITLDPDFSGSTADLYVYGSNADYSTARSTSYAYNETSIALMVGQKNNSFAVYRSFLKFDTSSIPDDNTVSQVNLKLTVYQDYSYTDFDVQIVKQDWSAQDPLSDTNRETAYDNCLSGDADDNIWRTTSGISANSTYTSGNLDTSWINKNGSTYYSLRSSRDVSANEPTGIEYINLHSAESTTASYRPVLVVVYTASQNYTLTCAAGSYSLTGTACTLTVRRNYVLSCGAGSYNLTGTNADLKVQRNYTLSCEAGSYSLLGTNADLVVQRNYSLICEAGSYALTGSDTGLFKGLILSCGAGSYALTGTDANLIIQRNYTLNCEAGNYSLTGSDADLVIRRNYVLSCEAGSYSITGTNTNLVIQRNYTLNCEAGVYVLTGTDCTLIAIMAPKNYTLVCEAGSYALTGTDVNFIIGKNYTLLCNAGSYALTGTDADLTVQRNYTLICEVGSYTLTGTDANFILQRNYTLECGAGSYSLTGADVSFVIARNYTLTCEVGSYALTGTDVNLTVQRNYILVCEAGSYVLTGTDADLVVQRNYTLLCGAGNYTLTGTDATFILQRNYTLVCEDGSYFLTGTDAELVFIEGFHHAEIWDGYVVMNLAIADSVILNREINEGVIMNREITDTYSELEKT